MDFFNILYIKESYGGEHLYESQKSIFITDSIFNYYFINVFLIIHILVLKNLWKVKIMFISIYTLILILQEVFIASTFFNNSSIWLAFLVKNVMGIIIIFVPFLVRYLHYMYTLEHQFFNNQ